MEWTAGQSADGHAVLLFNADTFAFVDGDFLSDPTVVEYTFKGVVPGDYYVVVASYQDQDDGSRDYEYDGNGKDVTVKLARPLLGEFLRANPGGSFPNSPGTVQSNDNLKGDSVR